MPCTKKRTKSLEFSSDALFELSPQLSAKNLVSGKFSIKCLLLLLCLSAALYFEAGYTINILVLGVNLIYLIVMLSKAIIFCGGIIRNPLRVEKNLLQESLEGQEGQENPKDQEGQENQENQEDREDCKGEIGGIVDDDDSLPIYSILIPLYKETDNVRNLLRAIRDFDYPQEKLDIKMIVEEDDDITIDVVKGLEGSFVFDTIVVPVGEPRTKPRACNYALQFIRGQFVTIYDAEDLPQAGQLKQALRKFCVSSKDVICLQARLNYYNRVENWLTKMFSLEYSLWFDFLIRGLAAFNIPIPLGGTSNHFKSAELKRIGGWDAYNVTEDADLGMRLLRFGYKSDIIDSLTNEEATITVSAWLRQRSRWIKGFIQTYFVHMRNISKIYREFGWARFLGFQIFIGAPFIIFMTTPFIILITLFNMVGIAGSPAAGIPGASAPDANASILSLWRISNILSLANFILAAISIFAAGVLVITKRKWYDISLYILLFPLYWLLHSVAGIKAAWQFIFKPYYWEKTTHGKSKYLKKG